MNIICPYCGYVMELQTDFDYDEVFGEGEGVVSYYHCDDCGCNAEFSLRIDDKEDD